MILTMLTILTTLKMLTMLTTGGNETSLCWKVMYNNELHSTGLGYILIREWFNCVLITKKDDRIT